MLIVIVGSPVWGAQAEAHLLNAGHAVQHYREQERYVARLADDGAALILVDLPDPDWRFWVTTPKTSPATRRIPVIAVGDDETRQAAALIAGADQAISTDQIATLEQIVSMVNSLIRPDEVEALSSLCDEPLPPEAQEAVARFNAGEYYRQHDLFEALWMAETRPIRDLYRAVLQVGIAYYQIEQGNWRGAHKMLLRSLQWLTPLPAVCQEIDIAALRADAAAVRLELERVGESGLAEFDRSLLKGVRLTTTPSPSN